MSAARRRFRIAILLGCGLTTILFVACGRSDDGASSPDSATQGGSPPSTMVATDPQQTRAERIARFELLDLTFKALVTSPAGDPLRRSANASATAMAIVASESALDWVEGSALALMIPRPSGAFDATAILKGFATAFGNASVEAREKYGADPRAAAFNAFSMWLVSQSAVVAARMTVEPSLHQGLTSEKAVQVVTLAEDIRGLLRSKDTEALIAQMHVPILEELRRQQSDSLFTSAVKSEESVSADLSRLRQQTAQLLEQARKSPTGAEK